jgi:hypothetical protein
VDAIPIQDFAQACRIFMKLAYPDAAQIPDKKRCYGDIPSGACIADYVSPAPRAAAICLDLSKNGVAGCEFRLGCAHHPNLKLRVQRMEYHHREVWVYSVDTHDRLLQAAKHLSNEEAEACRKLVEKNTLLKQQIEEALADAGFMTPIGLLRVDLTAT